jgi:signal transduction histidine kinase
MSGASSGFRSVGGVRQRVLTAVGALVLLTLVSSALGLFRITRVNRKLEAIHGVTVPLTRLAARLQTDGDIYARELSKRLGPEARLDSYRRSRTLPLWIRDLLRGSLGSARQLLGSEEPWADASSKQAWRAWGENLDRAILELEEASLLLSERLSRGDAGEVEPLAARWHAALEQFSRQLEWGTLESEKLLRQAFSDARENTSEVRSGLEAILAVLFALSLLLFWIGEKALRPLGELTRLARAITERGGVFLREDKVLLDGFVGTDEVSTLGRELHRMATALMEREKSVEEQRQRLVQSNQQLREVRDLNRDILSGIESPLVVTDLAGVITQANARAVSWLEAADLTHLTGTRLLVWPRLQASSLNGATLGSGLEAVRRGGTERLEWKEERSGSVFAARFFPLKQGDSETVRGAIVVFDDLTEERRLADRLRHAENLASIGRLSAQVAHEVRNPLHSIGLEAELALETMEKGSSGGSSVRSALQSILTSVERLEGVTETYLKLARPGGSVAQASETDLGDCLEEVLATYGSQLEASRIRVDWSRTTRARIAADAPLLEQAIGNLLRNSIEALLESRTESPSIRFEIFENESDSSLCLAIEDNGPGVPKALQGRLFTPFVTGRASGTGLGLSFVRKTVEDFGGEVRLVPRPGARFELRFPRAPSLMNKEFQSERSRIEEANSAR